MTDRDWLDEALRPLAKLTKDGHDASKDLGARGCPVCDAFGLLRAAIERHTYSRDEVRQMLVEDEGSDEVAADAILAEHDRQKAAKEQVPGGESGQPLP